MKVLFVMGATGRTGGNRAVFEVSNRLFERGYGVEIVALGGDHRWFNVRVPVRYVPTPRLVKVAVSIYNLLRLRGVRYDAFAVERVARRLGFHADLVRLISEHIGGSGGYDAYIATWYPTALSLYLSGVDGCSLYFLQDFPELVGELDGAYGLRLFDLTLRLPFNVFLSVSSYARELVVRVQPNARVIVTGAGVDLNAFKPRRESMVDVGGKKKVMVIVRGLKFKGDDVAIQALNIASRRIPIHAIIVGGRRIVGKLFSNVRPEFSYTVFEDVDDETLAKLYSSADLFIYTSYAESFGLPPLEAMACGTPVAMTDCRGCRDYAVNGYNSLIAPPGDVKAIADLVVKALQDDKVRERLTEGGLETAKQWTWDRVTDKFTEGLAFCNNA